MKGGLATDAGMRWDAQYMDVGGAREWPCEALVRAVCTRRAALGLTTIGDTVEVGCGNGANLWFLAEHAQRLVGLDCSTVALSQCRRYMRRRLGQERAMLDPELFLGDITVMLPFETASMDTVVDVMTSQHLPMDQHAALYGEYARVLRPGGWLFLYHLDIDTTHDADYGARRLDPNGFDWTHVPIFPTVGLICLPSPMHLRRLVIEAGFVAPTLEGVHRTYDSGACASYTIIHAERR